MAMTRSLSQHRTAFVSAEGGVAAIEFAVLAPVLLLLVGLLIDFGHGFNTQLRLATALHAGAQYAISNGAAVTAQSAPAFLDNVRTVVTGAASFSSVPTVTAKFNNAAGGGNAGNYYCVRGSGGTSWVSTGKASGSCGGNLSSGKFVTITATAPVSYFFLPSSIAKRIALLSDTVIVRVQ